MDPGQYSSQVRTGPPSTPLGSSVQLCSDLEISSWLLFPLTDPASLSKKTQVSWELGWLKQLCHSQCANEFLKLLSGMRLQGGVGSVPFSLFLKKKKKRGLSFCEWVYTHTYTRPLTQKKPSISNCPKLLKVIFPSLRSQNVQVLD